MRLINLAAALVFLLVNANSAMAAKKPNKGKKPAGVVVTADQLFDVTSAIGVIRCLYGQPPQAGTIKTFKGKQYFLNVTKEYAKKIATAKKNQKLSKKRKNALVLKLQTARDERNGYCVSGDPTPPNGVPLPAECISLAKYSGPWNADAVRRIYKKAAWGATYADVAAGVANGLDATVEQALLRTGGAIASPELNERIYDWRDNVIGNQSIQDPTSVNFDGVRYGEFDNFVNNPNPYQTHLLHLIHQKIAASYRVINSNGFRHHFFGYRDMLATFVATGDYAELVRQASNNELYMLIWLNLGASDKFVPNEDGPRELMQLVGMGQFNAGDPNHGMNYTSEDIKSISLAMVEGWSVSYDNTQQKYVKTLTPSKAYDGPPLAVGAGTPWARTIKNRQDVIDLLLSRKETAYDIARWLIEAYAYRNPPPAFVRNLGDIIFADGFKLYTRAIPMLLKSQALFSSCARDAIARDPAELMVGLLRSSGIPMSPIALDERVRNAGLTVWNPVTVFGYAYDSSYSARQLMERQNGIVAAIANTSYHKTKSWTFENLIPGPGSTAENIIDTICGSVLGIDLLQYPNLKTQLLGYADFYRQNDGTYDRIKFDYYETHQIDPATGDIIWETRNLWETKMHGFMQTCAMTPFFQSK